MNMIEGPMDGAKGDGIEGGRQAWIGWGKWWWENGDNCIHTSIKKKVKKKKCLVYTLEPYHKMILFNIRVIADESCRNGDSLGKV